MTELIKCPRCHEFRWNHCKCILFQCAIPWQDKVDEGSWIDVYASDAEFAAEKFAEQSDCEGDYTIIRNQEGEVWVRDVENVITKWHIEAESVPTYRARKKRALAQGSGQ